MSLISGLSPTVVTNPSQPQVIQAEAAEETRSAQSEPTPNSPASFEENQPVPASNPTRENANAANSDVATGATSPTEAPAKMVRQPVDADPQSVVLALSDDEPATVSNDDDQVRRMAEAAQAAYAQQAMIDRVADRRADAAAEAASRQAVEQPVDPGPSLVDLGEFAAADAEDPLAA